MSKIVFKYWTDMCLDLSGDITGKCTIEMGLILEDILTSLERISDHCSNIAVELLAINEDVYDTHEYYEEMSEAEQALFTQNYKRLKERYSLGKPEEESES